MHIFYLHGFASSARSSKARFFAAKLAPLGLSLHVPDFNQPEFATLTITRMIDQVEAAIVALPPGPVALIGSSLGGFVAWHVADRERRLAAADRRVERLVLLAPALDFDASRLEELGEPGLRSWRETGWKTFFHYGDNQPREVHYALVEDSRQYRSEAAAVTLPGLIFQGRHDAAVDPATVARFAAARPSLTLHELDDDHQLIASLDVIWEGTAAFLGLPQSR